MRRRDFLKGSVVAAGAAAWAGGGPLLLGITDKAESKTPVVGKDEHRYEAVHGWGELPAHLRWETTHGVCVDGEGLVYIKHQGFVGRPPQDTIVVFDPQGKFVRSFGKDYYPGGHGIDLRKEGSEEFLYFSNVAPVRTVVKTTLGGDVIWKKSFPTEAKVYRDVNGFSPTNVAFAPDGGFYVGD